MEASWGTFPSQPAQGHFPIGLSGDEKMDLQRGGGSRRLCAGNKGMERREYEPTMGWLDSILSGDNSPGECQSRPERRRLK